MTFALWMLGAVVAFLVLAVAHHRFWGWWFRVDVPYAAILDVPAEDGAVVSLRRVPGKATPAEAYPPILVLHGVAANHRNLDLDGDSLPRRLAATGRDVWLATLRMGAARRAPAGSVTIDAMARADLPALLAALTDRTECSSVDVIAYSLGGVVLARALGGGAVVPGALRRVVMVGVPGTIVVPPLPGLGLLMALPRGLSPGPWLRVGAVAISPLAALMALPGTRWLFALPWASPARARALVNVVQPIAPELLTWLGAAASRRAPCHEPTTLSALHCTAVPALFIAGDADGIVPPPCAEAAHAQWGDPAHRRPLVVVAGQAHGDLAFGPEAQREIAPRVRHFLDDRELADG